MRADEIIVLKDGHVLQRGRHQELLQQEGLYRQIFDLELKDQEEALGEIAAAAEAASSSGHSPNGKFEAGVIPPRTPVSAGTSVLSTESAAGGS